MHISVVIPVFNEEKSLDALYSELRGSLDSLPSVKYEIIFVDDGSRDAGGDKLKAISAKDGRVKIITLARNYGQTAAIVAGFDHASGDYIVTMDADLQNDPRDIPALLEKVNEGFDLVSGWRRERKDRLISRRIPSWLANWIIRRATGVRLHDFGCTLKVYKKAFIKDIRLYGEMHRYIPVYVGRIGGKIGEVKVNHRSRQYGASKNGIKRIAKVIFDLFTVKLLLGSSSTSPLYFFGSWGLGGILLGLLCAFIALAQRVISGSWAAGNYLLLLCVFFIIAGFQVIFMGLLAEINIRIYYELGKRPIYSVSQKTNL